MGIWYMYNRTNFNYIKFIIFNSGKVKIVKNDNMNRKNQTIQLFKDGANFLDALINLFNLNSLDLSELIQWIINEY